MFGYADLEHDDDASGTLGINRYGDWREATPKDTSGDRDGGKEERTGG